jgi:D-tyrosyl-tRNA(Tyr) deacylase
MKAVVQRVSTASVSVEGAMKGTIDRGLVVLLGIAKGDAERDAALLAEKVRKLRIFEDDTGKLNHSLEDIGGAALVISQFTLYADTSKGRRPSFTNAAPYDKARSLYEFFVEELKRAGIRTEAGVFGQRMLVTIHNEGPVTIILSTEQKEEGKRVR